MAGSKVSSYALFAYTGADRIRKDLSAGSISELDVRKLPRFALHKSFTHLDCVLYRLAPPQRQSRSQLHR